MKPKTVVKWHEHAFLKWWRWKSRRKGGRPTISQEIRALIRRLSRENVLWSAETIHGHLVLLGFDPPCPDTIRKYMVKTRGGTDKSQTKWEEPISGKYRQAERAVPHSNGKAVKLKPTTTIPRGRISRLKSQGAGGSRRSRMGRNHTSLGRVHRAKTSRMASVLQAPRLEILPARNASRSRASPSHQWRVVARPKAHRNNVAPRLACPTTPARGK
jgi:hypothetical protein